MVIKEIRIEKIYKLILISILIFSALIYFYCLNKEGLLTDEYLSLYSAQQSPYNILFNHRKETNPNTIPPLYVLILHYWLKIFGMSESAQRSLSAVFGILSVYALYRLAHLFFDIRTGIISALFGSLSFSWFLVFRQNRCYSLFILLTLLSFYAFFYLIKNRNSRYAFFFLTVINILLIYTHYFAFLVIFLEVIFGVLQWKKYKQGLLNILVMCIIINTAYLSWYENLFYDFKREPIVTNRTYPDSITRAIFNILRIIFFDFHFEWYPMLTILYLPFLIRGIKRLKRKFPYEFRHFPLYLILIFIIPFIFLFSVVSSDRIRYYAPFMFPLLILLAYGIQDLNFQGKLRRLGYFSLFTLIISNNIMDFFDFYHYNMNEEWKQAAQLIKQIPDYQNKKNVFIFQTRYNPPVFSYYYWNNRIAAHFIDNISTKDTYENDLSVVNVKDKIYVIEDMKGKDFFKKLASFSDSAWIWIFRYHDRFFPDDFRFENENRYFFHRIKFDKEIPLIDIFLLKRIKNIHNQRPLN